MAESTRLVDLVQAAVEEFLDEKSDALDAIADELSPMIAYSRDLLTGGKRFRALFCYWGWEAAGASAADDDSLSEALPPSPENVLWAAAALEFFHAAALVHDDLIDNSDTRRGLPSAHRRFESLHREEGFSGNAGEFGRSGAILLGDLLLSWSEELFARALEATSPVSARDARREFDRMRTEVMAGQYLDILGELSWRNNDEEEQLPRAHRVIVYKSAKYSVEAPLVIGAALGGASTDVVQALSGFGLPLGIAYQLRDDLLGVFGDPAVTGKPSGDDLREGKRTVLIALARAGLPGHASRFIDESLGERELGEEQIRMLQQAVRESGAVDQVERIIERNVAEALAALEGARITRAARDQLTRLTDTVIRRTH